MTGSEFLLIGTLLSSALPGAVIFLLKDESRRLRTTLNLLGAGTKVLLVGLLLRIIAQGEFPTLSFSIWGSLAIELRADGLAMLLATLSAILWLLTTIYAVGYFEGSPHCSRFFGFFSLCVTATMGVAVAGNLFTFLLFYEILTFVTYPLVVHRGTKAALHAGKVYLAYTLSGGMVLMLGVVWLQNLAGTTGFIPGGILNEFATARPFELRMLFVVLMIGLGVKAAMVPLHGWLPQAMVAPAPVSALLHAVAVVKVGAFGIVRVVTEIYGFELVRELSLGTGLAIVASVTILYGSIRAITQENLKRLLAYSTVSQVSYIVLGVALASPIAAVAGVVHLVHQGLMKISLFLCAGVLAETFGIHRIDEMNGVGRHMPWTMGAFSLAALGMIGAPPMAGFVTKWELGIGSLDAGAPWVLVVLVVSSLLNAVYFLPILHRVWFGEPAQRDWSVGSHLEAPALMLYPAVITAALALLVGLLANFDWSPLGWAKLIVAREWLP